MQQSKHSLKVKGRTESSDSAKYSEFPIQLLAVLFHKNSPFNKEYTDCDKPLRINSQLLKYHRTNR